MTSLKTCLLVIASGMFVGIAGSLSMGIGFAIYPLFQIVGALLEPWFRNLGLGLMCFGNILVSFWVFLFAGLFLLHPDLSAGFRVIFLLFISALLMIVSDRALVREYLRVRKMRKAANQ